MFAKFKKETLETLLDAGFDMEDIAMMHDEVVAPE